MAITGIQHRWKGKVKANTLILGTGGVVDSAYGTTGKMVVAQRMALPVTATANTDFVMSMPVGATILRAHVTTTTAYTGNTVTIQIGAAAAGAGYVAAVDIKPAGYQALTLVTATAYPDLLSMPQNLFIRVVQTATTTAVGAATLVVEYAMP